MIVHLTAVSMLSIAAVKSINKPYRFHPFLSILLPTVWFRILILSIVSFFFFKSNPYLIPHYLLFPILHYFLIQYTCVLFFIRYLIEFLAYNSCVLHVSSLQYQCDNSFLLLLQVFSPYPHFPYYYLFFSLTTFFVFAHFVPQSVSLYRISPSPTFLSVYLFFLV